MHRRRLIALVAALAAPGLMGSSEQKDDKKKQSVGDYVEVHTLAATITRLNGKRGVMTVQCGLDVPDPKLRAKTELYLPRLRSAYIQTLQTYASGMTPATPPNGDVLAQALQRDTDRILGQRGAKLLLGAMLIN